MDASYNNATGRYLISHKLIDLMFTLPLKLLCCSHFPNTIEINEEGRGKLGKKLFHTPRNLEKTYNRWLTCYTVLKLRVYCQNREQMKFNFTK